MKSLVLAGFYALRGVLNLLKEKSAQREVVLLLISILMFVRDTSLETLFLVVIALITMSLESLNTAIEEICDVLTTEKNECVAKIKDLGAASILICLVAWAMLCIFYILNTPLT